jgi:hypothetical protein
MAERVKDPSCDLCGEARITTWFHEDEHCWIADCELCDVPMVVWRNHRIDPSADDLAHLHAELGKVANREIGEFYVDDNMRNIPDHYHAHARPKGAFFGHHLSRPVNPDLPGGPLPKPGEEASA